MKRPRVLIVLMVLWLALFGIPWKALAGQDEYDDSQSHPLRVLSYAVYPAALMAEWFIFRPIHFLVGATKPQEYVFGHKPHPPLLADPQPDHNYGMSTPPPARAPEKPKIVQPPAPASERVTVKEVPVIKTVYQEVEKIVEVEKVVFPDIAFRANSTDLTDLGKGKAYLVAQKLKENSDVVVAIEGHADAVGSDDFNQKLALRRAQRVMAELTQLGVDANRLSIASFGESKPLIDQQTDWAHAVNRRVEFRVTAR